jgi:hypothetical protein
VDGDLNRSLRSFPALITAFLHSCKLNVLPAANATFLDHQNDTKMFAFTSDSLVWKGQTNHFQLFSGEELLLDLLFLKSGEQECRINGHSFFFERTGFWNPIYQVTQDGTQVMRMQHQFWGSRAFISFAALEGALEMRYKNDPQLSLIISKGAEQIIRYSLQLGLPKSPFRIEMGNYMLEADHLLLLLALCFILTKDIVKEYHGGQNEQLFLLLATA